MKRTLAVLGFLSSLSACVSMSPRAQGIHLYPQGDAHFAHCERLGRLSAEAAGLGQLNVENADQQAKNNLLDAAAGRWPGRVNSVELMSVEKGALNVTAVGVAFDCAM
jgi:hypothetical protein